MNRIEIEQRLEASIRAGSDASTVGCSEATGIRGYSEAGIRGYSEAGIRGYSEAGIRAYSEAGVSGCTDAGTSGCSGASTNGWNGSLHGDLTGTIIGAAIAVHRALGPGKLESVYHRALAIELRARGVPFRSQVPIPMTYRGESVGDFFADLIVDERVIVELKAIDVLRPVHRAQVLSYLRATGLELGLLINFNVHVLRDGVRRLIQSANTRP